MGERARHTVGVDASNREDTGVYPAAKASRPPVRRRAMAAQAPAPQRAPASMGGVRADRLLGEVIADRYRVEKRLARGAMGCVYVARQLQLDRTVAIKVLDPKAQNETDSVFRERFLREAGTLARLAHPHTVRVFDYGSWKGCTYLVMEHVDGQSLRRLQQHGPIPAGRMLRIGGQICDALREAHALGLIHRDLKPANILLTRHAGAVDVVKVVDFGLAKDFHANHELTQAGQVLGTPMYMAPEQIRDEACDQRTDIYALGVLLYRGITGHTPFPKDKAMAVLMAHLKRPVPSFATIAPELSCPPIVEKVVRTCLAKDPDDRFANVGELKKALQIALLALDHPSRADLDFTVERGLVVLPAEVVESTGGHLALSLDDLAPPAEGPIAGLDDKALVAVGGLAAVVGALVGFAVGVLY